MRAVLVIGLVGCVGCGMTAVDDPTRHDADDATSCNGLPACGEGEVCAHGSGCLAPEDVYAVHLNWTLSGQPASNTTCAETPDLVISFSSDDRYAALSYAPVPCSAGRFSIDRVARTVTEASLVARGGEGERQSAMLDPVTGEATIDLPL